jgi:hypothetical protein
MRRRNLITLLSSATVAWPLASRAQPSERMRLIGVLIASPEGNPGSQARLTAARGPVYGPHGDVSKTPADERAGLFNGRQRQCCSADEKSASKGLGCVC